MSLSKTFYPYSYCHHSQLFLSQDCFWLHAGWYWDGDIHYDQARKKELVKRLLKSDGLYTISFLTVSLVLDGLLYHNVYFPGLGFSLILELASKAMLALGYRHLKSYTFMTVLTFIVIVRWVMSAIFLSLRWWKYWDKVFEYVLKGFFVLKEGLTMIYLLK